MHIRCFCWGGVKGGIVSMPNLVLRFDAIFIIYTTDLLKFVEFEMNCMLPLVAFVTHRGTCLVVCAMLLQ